MTGIDEAVRDGRERPLRVLLCPDQPDWAFDNIARNIRSRALSRFLVSIHYMGKPGSRELSDLYERLVVENIDILHVFWREDLFELLRPVTLIEAAGKLGVAPNDIVDMICGRALTSSVYDHLHLTETAVAERSDSFHLLDGYTVCSQRLWDIYSDQPDLPGPDALITDGVDIDRFSPGGERAGRTSGSTIRIGWVGNSQWGASLGTDPKGFHRLLKPTVDLLERRGRSVELVLADPHIRRIPFAEMPDFYRSVDLLACTSAAEGTPNPVLEAMASAVPVVSTDVGIVPEVFGPRQSAFIVRNPDPERFADAIERLCGEPDVADEIRTENRERVMAWSWRARTEPWWSFWELARRRCAEDRLASRRRQALRQSCSAYANFLAANAGRDAPVPRLLRRLNRRR